MSSNFNLQLLACFLLALGSWPVAAQETTSRIWAVGDSITHGLGDTGVECFVEPRGGYPDRLRRRLRDSTGLEAMIINLGECGEVSGEVLTRLNVLLETDQPDIVLLMAGTNDLSSSRFGWEGVRRNLLEMAEAATAAGVRPVIASPIPRSPESGRSNVDTELLADALIVDTLVGDIEYADLFHELIDINNLYDRLYFDPLHPNPLGYEFVAEGFVDPTAEAIRRLASPEPCMPGPTNLCLNRDRFKVEVEWEDFDGNTGVGQALPRTADTGMFWFFNEDNIELVIKVLDGRVLNDHFWVFYGALSTVRYVIRVTDTETGFRRVYFNPSGTQASVGDTSAFFVAPVGASVASEPQAKPSTTRIVRRAATSLAATKGVEACTPDDLTLCLQDGRFRLRVSWRDFDDRTGVGHAVTLTDETGYFWFFNAANVELVIKVLDGRSLNGHFWVFYGALSNVAYDITVTDTVTGEELVYSNPLTEFGSLADTEAFMVPPP